MQRVPTFLLVGIVGGLAGAGITWLFTRGPFGTHWIGSRQSMRNAENFARIGVPQAYETQTQPALKTNAPPNSGGYESEPRIQDQEGGHVIPSLIPVHQIKAPNARLSESPAIAGATPLAKGAEAARAAAHKAAAAQEGVTLRKEYWTGSLQGASVAIVHQLFRGNDYWFWAGTDDAAQGVQVHVYDSSGNLAEKESWRQADAAASRVIPPNTGSYYIVVSGGFPASRELAAVSHWALVYGNR